MAYPLALGQYEATGGYSISPRLKRLLAKRDLEAEQSKMYRFGDLAYRQQALSEQTALTREQMVLNRQIAEEENKTKAMSGYLQLAGTALLSNAGQKAVGAIVRPVTNYLGITKPVVDAGTGVATATQTAPATATTTTTTAPKSGGFSWGGGAVTAAIILQDQLSRRNARQFEGQKSSVGAIEGFEQEKIRGATVEPWEAYAGWKMGTEPTAQEKFDVAWANRDTAKMKERAAPMAFQRTQPGVQLFAMKAEQETGNDWVGMLIDPVGKGIVELTGGK